jgi:acyl-coenzyme A thioesterase PaaI-like protein
VQSSGAGPRGQEALRIYGSRLCFVCGQENPGGLRLRFAVDGRGGAEASWCAAAPHQGFAGVIHGGVVLSVLDEAMWYAAFGLGGVVMTAEANVRYRRRVEVGQELRVVGTVERRRGRLWECAAALCCRHAGEPLATATGKFLAAPAEDVRRLWEQTQVHELPRALGT